MGAQTSRNVTNTYASLNRVAHSAAANPPPGTPQGTVPHPNSTNYSITSVIGDRGSTLGINLVGNAIGNQAMAHFTPSNPDAHMSNLLRFEQLGVEVSHLPH